MQKKNEVSNKTKLEQYFLQKTILELIQFMRNNDLGYKPENHEGIFRLSTNKKQLDTALEQIEAGKPLHAHLTKDLLTQEPFLPSALLKRLLLKLKNTGYAFIPQEEVQHIRDSGYAADADFYKQPITDPILNALFPLMKQVADNHEQNKMEYSNLALMVTPNLFPYADATEEGLYTSKDSRHIERLFTAQDQLQQAHKVPIANSDASITPLIEAITLLKQTSTPVSRAIITVIERCCDDPKGLRISEAVQQLARQNPETLSQALEEAMRDKKSDLSKTLNTHRTTWLNCFGIYTRGYKDVLQELTNTEVRHAEASNPEPPSPSPSSKH